MKVLIIDNGSKGVDKVHEHIDDAAKEYEVESNDVKRVTVEDLKEAYDTGDTEFVKGFDYILSSGSGKQRKYDSELHKFVADNADPDAVYLGICHGAQQMAVAHDAELKNSGQMHRGQRESTVTAHHKSLEGVATDEKMTHHAHHQYYIPTEKAGTKLEVIAETQSEHTGENFVEMYKVLGKDYFGIQSHPEKGEGKVIKNLYKLAHEKKKPHNTYK